MSTLFTPHINALPDTIPFVGPETIERNSGRKFKARIGANESAFGMSTYAYSALHDAINANGCNWYGDPENYALKAKLAEQHSIGQEHICVDAGIDSLLGLCIRLFVSPGQTVVTSSGAYPTVNYHVNGYGGILKTVAYKNHHEDTTALAQAAQDSNAKLVYLANPDNPMGTSVCAQSIKTLLDSLPGGCLLMLDEAYIEFMSDEQMLALDVSDNRLIRFRTFSKAYGLAGMRIGYVLAHEEIINGFNRIRNHFGVNRLAQAAALASLDDVLFIKAVKQKVDQGRNKIYDLAKNLSLEYLPSSTNFVAVNIGNATSANTIITRLAEHGIFMRKPAIAPQDTFIRIGVGTQDEFDYLSEKLPAVL